LEDCEEALMDELNPTCQSDIVSFEEQLEEGLN